MKKITRIEILRWKSAFNAHGAIDLGFDAVFVQQTPPEDREPAHVLSMGEPEARSLMMLLKAQLAEFDKKKARSQR
ncbi:MAG: hypothetical protein RL722_1084 [Pseudomonadota bacterium]|jgi:hypothetical protein